jgi:hypothetical protein
MIYSKYYISCKNKNLEYERFEVPKEIYIYIRQLENYILNPELSKLKETYREKYEYKDAEK